MKCGQRNMSKQETLLLDGLRSELILQQQRKALSEALRQQLLETEKRHSKELERRVHEDARLSADQESRITQEVNHRAKFTAMRRSDSMPVQTSNKETVYHPRKSERQNTSSPDWQFPTSQSHYSVMSSTVTPTRAQQCERPTPFKTTQMMKEEEAEAECQKKFRASPVPCHVTHPHYQDMMVLREKKREQGREQRKEFLVSIQKPFSFQERESVKKEKLLATTKQVSKDQKSTAESVRKTSRKVVKDSSSTEPKDQEECKPVPAQRTGPQKNPAASGSPKLRTAERNRKEKLAFLYEKPSFQPRIIHQVPDFSRLHKALQTERLRKTQSKDEIKCQPFTLRTSALPARRYRRNPESTQEPKLFNLSRSKSLGNLKSLSTDTLPIYITDAVRKRCTAIRHSIEMRDSKNQESANWLRKSQMRSQAMKKSIALHAKLLDPHSSWKEVHNEKLQHHWRADQQRTREYMRDLRDMKARVGERPYLFEQVKQKTAKAHAEQVYRNELKNVGIREEFVQENGEGISISSGSEDNTDENDIQSREENADDGEEIEDVEGKSVKSKGEEMP
ncbi:protein FAM161B [Brachionichthys hirsutus]|uniref:protein FAM161B n=1 Tax=Brachionichthys hirsutus TaxID=412623 RepID=UPI0036047DE7